MQRFPFRSESLRRMLREVAEQDAGAILSRARERARARAAQVLEDALVEELIDAAGRLGSGGRAAPRKRDEGEQPLADLAWWTYCVLPADEAGEVPPGLDGVEPGSTVEVVRDGELAALVSAVPSAEYDDARLREHLEDLDWVSATARRHEAVLDAALAHATIVPLRLCTLYRDKSGVRRLLHEQAVPLRLGLAKVEGCAEWGVKVFAGEQAGDVAMPASGAGEGRAEEGERPGATYLLERRRERERAERVSELRALCAQAVHDRISHCSREATTNPPQRPEVHGRELSMLLNGAYLVEDARRRELYESVGALQEEWQARGFVIELTGPWPAYNFVGDAAGIVS